MEKKKTQNKHEKTSKRETITLNQTKYKLKCTAENMKVVSKSFIFRNMCNICFAQLLTLIFMLVYSTKERK